MQDRHIRVVQLLPELNEGGVERGVVELNREFSRRNLDSHVISCGGRLVGQIEKDGGHHVRFDICTKNPLTTPVRVLGLRRLLRALQPDIIHARSRVPAWLALFANRSLRIPFVTTVHGMNSVSSYSRVMTRGDRVICVSEVVREYIMKHYRVNEDRITVIQRGVDMELFDPGHTDADFMRDFRRQFGLENRFVVTSVGRITWLKDYESFIEAIARCRKNIPNIIGVIVGGVRKDKREYMAGLSNLAEELGVGDRIVFAGNQMRMPEIYSLSDVVVNASLKMGNVGRTVTEALAMNTPVVATTFKGLQNLVKDGLNGYIIPNRSPGELAECLLKLYRASITDTRSTVPREFTLDSMVTETIAVYRSLVGRHADGQVVV